MWYTLWPWKKASLLCILYYSRMVLDDFYTSVISYYHIYVCSNDCMTNNKTLVLFQQNQSSFENPTTAKSNTSLINQVQSL